METGADNLPANRTFAQRLSRPLLTGVLGFLPLALTLAVLAWVVVFVHDLVGPYSPIGRVLATFGLGFVACEVLAWTAGMFVLMLSVYIMGAVIESGAARRYEGYVEGAMQRVPLVNTIYDASKQLTSMFDRKKDAVKMMTPVYCTFGGEGGAVLLALMPSSERIRIGEQDYHVVIIPTAPVPFGGALLLVPVHAVKPANCSFDGMVNVFMSMGVSAPDVLGVPSQTKLVTGTPTSPPQSTPNSEPASESDSDPLTGRR